MTPISVAELLERYARDVEQLPGVSRTNPHVFAEAKGELAYRMRRQAIQLRTPTPAAAAVATIVVAAIAPGPRLIAGRTVSVERRRRAS